MSGGDEVARQLEQRMEVLLELTGSLAAAASEDAVAHAVARIGMAAIDATFGGLWCVDRDKAVLRLVALSALPVGGVDRWTTVPLDIDAPLAIAVRTNTPIFIDSLADYRTRFPGSYTRIAATVASDDASYAMLPVADGGAPIAGLAITYERANALGASERTFLQLLARQCAIALERVRLHAAERAARFEAEEAMRAREEILSVVSHDLRNPLGTILIGVSSLASFVRDDDPNADRIRGITERVQRQSERMVRQLDDLVDFAGIQAGTLSIERRPTAPAKIVHDTAAWYGPVADERGLALRVELPDQLPAIDVDPTRAVQVLSNLVANAIKVTMKPGHVAIGASGGDEVVFHVRDTGPGIEADELPRLFERYWRSKKATYKGAGLGLSIARGIVDAHGGRIWAESQVGVGTTFFFTLTRR